MSISLPSGIFQSYFDTVDYLLEEPNIGKTCIVNYETKSTKDYNIYGEEIWTEATLSNDNIKLRVYYTPKNWVKTSMNVELIDGRIQILGYMKDVEKVKRSSSITIEGYDYKLATQPLRHGFGQRYFLAFMDLIS